MTIKASNDIKDNKASNDIRDNKDMVLCQDLVQIKMRGSTG